MSDALNIVVPVFNEAQSIGLTLSELKEKVKTPHKVFVVYDFPEDNTLPVVKEIMKTDDRIRLVRNKYGKGVLNAIKTGFETVPDGAVLVIMADLSDELDRVELMLNKIKEGYGVVCGSRYMKGGKQIGGPKFKGFLSRIAGLSLHFLAGIPTHDITNSFKMYSKEVLDAVEIKSTGGFELGMEIVVKAYLKGFKIAEIPSIWRDRQAGQSNFKLWKWLPKYIHWYFFAIKGKWFGFSSIKR